MLFPKFVAVFTAFAVTGASAQKCKCKANPCTTNLVQNGGFDSPLDGSPWVFNNMEVTSNNPRSPPQAALSQIRNYVQRNNIQQSIPWVKGKSYTLRYYWAIEAGTIPANSGCTIAAVVGSTEEDFELTNTPMGTYSLHEYTFTAPASNNFQLYVICSYRDVTLDVNVDDVSIYDASCLNPT